MKNTKLILLILFLILASTPVGCTPEAITETVTQTQFKTTTATTTQTLLPVTKTVTRIVTLEPAPTTTLDIATKTYINEDFRYKVRYPYGWDTTTGGHTKDFPDKESLKQFLFYSENGVSVVDIRVWSETKSVNQMIELDRNGLLFLPKASELIILDKGTDYYILLASETKGDAHYQEKYIFQKFNGFYEITVFCKYKTYLNNHFFRNELQIILNSFTFTE